MLTATKNGRKSILKEEKYNSTNFQTLWDFEGVFKYSLLFYGWYTNEDSKRGYWMPFAYFITGLVVYAYSFFAILKKMAENSRMSKLSEKDDECIFSWKLFTAWDYMIGNAETAHNRVASIVVGFKEALLEEAERKRESRNWKITCFRILVNTAVLGLLLFSAFAVVMVVKRSTELEARSTVWRSNEITVVMSLISLFFPMLFELLGLLEQYHPRKQLRLQLARIMVLNLLNLYSLIFALFEKINNMTGELENFRNESDKSSADAMISTATINTSLRDYAAVINCHKSCNNFASDMLPAANLIAAIATNASLSVYPIIQKALTKSTTESEENTTNFPSTLNSEFTITPTELPENHTSFYTNSTVFNSNLTSDFEEFQEAFVDYLTYILLGFSPNETDEANVTYLDSSVITYEYFKTTVAPLLNITESELDERFDPQLTTAFEQIVTTLSSFQNNLTQTEGCKIICINTTTPYDKVSLTAATLLDESRFNYTTRRYLRSLCWETMFGQELIKLTVMDLVMTILSTLAMDLIRGVFVRVMNRCWCWDLEKIFPQYGDFKVAENILHLVNNQGMVWMGMFFSPGLVVLNVVKLYALMYFRTWIVLTCNVPHEIIFRASRSNNFYYALLLMMLFLCVLPVGYTIVWITPSWNCGPFSNYRRIFHIFTTTIKHNVPAPIEKALDYIASPGIVIPLLVLLVLIIYYLISLAGALREANSDLKIQLRRERTEERRKMFQMADRRRTGGSGGSGEFSNTPFAKWKKFLGTIPNSGKSFDDTPKQDSNEFQQIKEEKIETAKNKDFFSKFIKKALRKSSTSDDENQENQNQDDGTDTEQHESLPEDFSIKDKAQQLPKLSTSSGSSDLQKRNSQKGNSESSDKVITKTEMRQDSVSSVWSDNIPVITISKTESAECLDVVPELSKVRPVGEAPQKPETRFKPKIKYALRKQSAEIDEDLICYFNKELESTPSTHEENPEREDVGGVSIKSESSDDTARESSAETVLNLSNVIGAKEEGEEKKQDDNTITPTNSSETTESSSGYNDVTSL